MTGLWFELRNSGVKPVSKTESASRPKKGPTWREWRRMPVRSTRDTFAHCKFHLDYGSISTVRVYSYYEHTNDLRPLHLVPTTFTLQAPEPGAPYFLKSTTTVPFVPCPLPTWLVRNGHQGPLTPLRSALFFSFWLFFPFCLNSGKFPFGAMWQGLRSAVSNGP